MADLEHADFPPITQLLDMALEFANNTWNEAAYYVLVAAGEIAFTDHMQWQVINTARFLGTNEYFTEALSLGGVDKYPADFVALADTLTRKEIVQRVFMDEIDADLETRQVHEWAQDDQAAFEEEMEQDDPMREARRQAAWAAALAYRNHRTRDDA